MENAELRLHLETCQGQSYRWALHCCAGDRVGAEDVLQTAYLKVLDGRARFDGRSSFSTWLFAVIRRTAADERQHGTSCAASKSRRISSFHVGDCARHRYFP